MEQQLSLLAQLLELGFSAAAAIAGGFFIVLLIKYILESVVGQAQTLHSMITQLDLRVKTMNNEIIRIDTLISTVVGVKPDMDRIARADGQKMQGKTDEFRPVCRTIWYANSDGRGNGILYFFHMEICNDTNQTKTWCNLYSISCID